MFGWINDCTEKLVLTKFGADVWHSIKEKANCTVVDGGFVRHKYYPDSSTVQLVVAASEVLGITVDQVLETFGTFFMEFVRAEGYENLLQCQGSTLQSWLSNMNALHDHLQSSLPPGMVAPVFWCESDDDHDGSMILHYYSKRGGLLVPLVVGVVKEVARFHFDVIIDMEMLRKQGEDDSTHTSWRIKATNAEENWKITMHESKLELDVGKQSSTGGRCPFSGIVFPSAAATASADAETDISNNHRSNAVEVVASDQCQVPATERGSGQTTPKTPCISSRTMRTLFPYHIVVDKLFEMIQVGAALPSLMKNDLVGQKIDQTFRISRPVLAVWDWQSLRKLEGQTFFVDAIDVELGHLSFKASPVILSEPDEALQVMFVLSPDVKNVAELKRMNLTMSDLPLHSFQRDAVFLGEHIVSEIQSADKLDRLSKKLVHEQSLSKALLHTLLPPHVADELRAGKTVQPKLHKNVTLFFSDIVGFTSICEQIFPWDCVDLLNRLYCVMDFLSSKFNLYKVETIGDSYFCASGLPYDERKHATNIANFALATMHCSKLVMNPLTGNPIELRVGIHSGPCMTGVVGMTTPHYCLFGDTVNTTSRHESTSLPGKIQCSSITYGLLEHFSDTKDFEFIPRGLIDMKGKGLMATYFLDRPTSSNTEVSPEALDALCVQLETILKQRTFSHRRYFRRYGKRASETFFGVGRSSLGGSVSSQRSQELDVSPEEVNEDGSSDDSSDDSSDAGSDEANPDTSVGASDIANNELVDESIAMPSEEVNDDPSSESDRWVNNETSMDMVFLSHDSHSGR